MSTTSTTDTNLAGSDLPRWDASYLFDSIESRPLGETLERLGAEAARLTARFDEAGIGTIEPRPATEADGALLDEALDSLNRFLEDSDAPGVYLYSVVSTDSRAERAASLLGTLEANTAAYPSLLARLAAWVNALGVDELIRHSPRGEEHEGPLRKLAARAEHQMTDSDETLYGELRPTGSGAWDQLHGELTSQLQGTIERGSGPERLPISALRCLATDPDPAVREGAYRAELAAWPEVLVACAAAMNAIKGEACVVNRRRGWANPVDASLFANNVRAETFAAMQEAITGVLPVMRRWMRAKAALHGHDGALPWWDLVAPAPGAAVGLSWEEGTAAVRAAFESFSPDLARVLQRALDERWLDVPPRDGKVGGAFCMGSIEDRSLVLLNWNGSMEGASTLAHELGHAYHNVQLAGRTQLQRMVPMTLAETASIMCETLMTEQLLGRGNPDEELAILDLDLAGANQLLVDIRSRFDFESAVFARRATGKLGVSELNELMLAAQRDTYGDGLDQTTAHPYMWAVKGHYYGSHFYNWPYTFGYLFGLGLFANYRTDPERFQAGYDDALSRVGMENAEPLAARFGFDIAEPAFWEASLDVVRQRVERYEALVARRRSDGA